MMDGFNSSNSCVLIGSAGLCHVFEWSEVIVSLEFILESSVFKFSSEGELNLQEGVGNLSNW